MFSCFHTPARNGALLRLILVMLLAGLSLSLTRPAAAAPSGLTYLGQLLVGGVAANGNYDFQFKLYDAVTGGTQVGSTVSLTSVPVAQGLYFASLYFGTGVITGQTLWLQISYRVHPSSGNPAYTTQSPRNVAPNSAFADYAQLSGSTAALQGKPISTTAPTTGQTLTWNGSLWAPQTPASGGTYTAGTGLTLSSNQFSVPAGGITNSLLANGAVTGSKLALPLSATVSGSVSLLSLVNTGSGSGIAGTSASSYGIKGIYGAASGLSGYYNSGLLGDTNVGNGVIGRTSASYGYGVLGITDTNGTIGVYGYTANTTGTGIEGNGGSTGVSGYGTTYGLYGSASNSDSSTNYGVYGSGTTYGVYGTGSSYGVYGSGAYGVFGSGTSVGLYGSGGTYGVLGYGSSYGLYGSGGTYGVYGYNSNSGSSGSLGGSYSSGVYGTAAGSGEAVLGIDTAANGRAIEGDGDSSQSGNYAGIFFGNVYVSGTLSKAGGSFKIDDPLDPAHKFLSHSFVESPDMKNIYDGTITTDASGNATVTLPDWFEALNQDFRYQLTAMGQFAQAIVATEIDGNQFTIKTDKPSVKVSWQVTGTRHDAWANAHRIPVEEDKPANEQGLYLNPKEFGQPDSKAIAPQHHGPSVLATQPKLPTLPPSSAPKPPTKGTQ